MPRLVVISEGLAGRTYDLKVDKTTVGRVEDNAFQIAEPSVSSHHCEIILRGNDVVVKDLNSTNGTFVGGQQVTGEAVVKPGQTFKLGQVELRLEDGAPQAPSAAAPTGTKAPAAPAPAPKKAPDHTMIIPQGVKLGEDTGTRGFQKDSPFSRKSNKGTKVFIGVAIFLGVVILGIIVWAIMNARTISPQ